MLKITIAITIIVGIYGLIYFLAKSFGEHTNIDEDDMTKTFKTMKKFNKDKKNGII